MWSFKKYFQKEIEQFSITFDREENYLNIFLLQEETPNYTIYFIVQIKICKESEDRNLEGNKDIYKFF